MTRKENRVNDDGVLQGKIDMDLVTKLLQSDVTTYRIGKITGISLGNLYQLRHGQREIRNLKITTAYLLSECAKQIGIE